jgi:hypothetical protein
VIARPLRLARNLWTLRRDLLAWAAGRYLERRAEKRNPPIRVICQRCGHELTKPCAPGSPSHAFRWTAEMGPQHAPGTMIYVRRQKPRAGELRPDYELRTKPF